MPVPVGTDSFIGKTPFSLEGAPHAPEAVGYDPRAMIRRITCLTILLASPLLVSVASAGSFPLAPSEAERRLAHQPFEILEAKRTASGVAGAQKWTVKFPDGLVMKLKWKAAPHFTADSWNNSPRREIAPYEIQKWFLDEKDYVVPTSEVRCIPIELYRKEVDASAEPTIRGTKCVFGVLSMWLQDVEEPPEIWHPEMFDQKNYYSYSIAAVDVLTLLIGHQDGRPANFLWSTDGDHHGLPEEMYRCVDDLPRDIVRRLGAVKPEQIDALGVLRQLELDANGVLQLTAPTKNLDPDEGTRIGRKIFQIGLRSSELGEIRDRIAYLQRETESGNLPLF